MPTWLPIAANAVLFQVIWLSSVLLGHTSYWISVPALVAMVVLGRNYKADLRLLAMLGGLGFILDSGLLSAGLLALPQQQDWIPFWWCMLWFGFALTLNHSIQFFVNKPLLGTAFGLIGGPLSYFGAARLGAVSIVDWIALIVIGLLWASIMYGVGYANKNYHLWFAGVRADTSQLSTS